MNTRIKQAMEAALLQVEQINQCTKATLLDELKLIFDEQKPYMEKVSHMDALFIKHPDFAILRELFFDLLLINFFTEDVQKLEEDYLESSEWADIEEATLDRGTELLNLLLYLKECEDEGIEPELDDFLKEFLLVNEDEFQDEHRIYEDMIAKQLLIEGSLEALAKATKNIAEMAELKELFYPMMSFFREQKPSKQEFEKYIHHSNHPAFDAAAYALLIAYRKS